MARKEKVKLTSRRSVFYDKMIAKNGKPSNGKRKRAQRTGRRKWAKHVRKDQQGMLTPALTLEYEKLLLEGIPFSTTSDILGIVPRVASYWLELGQTYLEAPLAARLPEYRDCAEFYLVVNQAQGKFKQKLIKRSFLPDHNVQSWIRDATYLERRDRFNWSRSDRVIGQNEIIGPDEKFL